ncbi:MAG: GxxExxY protein [Chitinophagaceae bacterium]
MVKPQGFDDAGDICRLQKRERISQSDREQRCSVRKVLGADLLESAWEKCFCYELAKRKAAFFKTKCIQIT